MPPRNNPVPNAVRLFNCAICDKGYPRQLDYENHLRSYDHNHRQRLADMKKLTANNDSEGNKPKQGLDMRTINVEDANKKPGVGSRFTKIGGGAAASGSRFKKVGVAVGKEAEKKEAEKKEAEKKEAEKKEAEKKDPEMKEAEKKEVDKQEEEPVVQSVEVDVANVRHGEKESAAEAASHQVGEAQKEVLATKSEKGEEDEEEEEDITWEKYDFTKPTGCDHQSCPGCKTDGIWSGEWVALGPE